MFHSHFSSRLQTTASEQREKVERSISGKTIHIYAQFILPIVAWRRDQRSGSRDKEGFHYSMLQALSQALNVTGKLEEPPEKTLWGKLSNDKQSYTGMIGYVGRSDVDMAIGSFFQVLPRTHAVDFALYSAGCTSLIVPKESKIENWKSVVNIFDRVTWATLLTVFLVYVFIFVITRALEQQNGAQGGVQAKKTSETLIWPDIVAQGTAMLMRKGDFSEEHPLFRIFMHAWIFLGFAFAGIFFKSILIQKLTTLEYEQLVNSVQDLAEKKVPLQYGELYEMLNGMYPQLRLDKLVDRSIVLPYKDCMKYIAEGNRAAMFLANEQAQFLQRSEFWDTKANKPLFNIANSCYMAASFGWIIPKHSYYGQAVKDTMKRFQEAGLTKKWESELVDKKRRALAMNVGAKDDGSAVRTLTIDDLGWIFYCYAYGQLIAVAAFILEWAKFALNRPLTKPSATIELAKRTAWTWRDGYT